MLAIALVDDVASAVKIQRGKQGAAFVVEYNGAIPERILTDSARLRQISSTGGQCHQVHRTRQRAHCVVARAHWRDGQPAVKFEVVDTGIGIRGGSSPQLFQPFNQGDTSITTKFGGTGLGLAISRHIARLLGGDMAVTSVWGEGSAFVLTLPTGSLENVPLLENAVEAIHDSDPHVWEAASDSPQDLRILLAEDGFDNRALIQTVLRMAGLTVEAVENGRLAVNKALHEPFDLILMDMNMPEMDGYEATRLLRQSGYEKPILALTANAMSGDSDRCLSAGCTGYMSKPINRAELIRAINRLVGKEVAAGQPTTPSGQNSGAAAAAASFGSPEETKTQIPALPCAAMGQSASCEDILISQFIDDPDMAPIIGGFVERLAGQLDAMRQTLDNGQHDQLRRLAHTLKGAGGSYGYPSLTEACRGLEEAAKQQDGAAAGAALAAVAVQIRAIQKGCPAGATMGETLP